MRHLETLIKKKKKKKAFVALLLDRSYYKNLAVKSRSISE